MESRHDLLQAGIPVLTSEGNMGDYREFDTQRTLGRIEAFFESLGIEKTDT